MQTVSSLNPKRPIEIACDESGSEGENLVETRLRIFAHGSTDLTIDEAHAVIDSIRMESGSRAREIKSTDLLKGRNAGFVYDLFREDGPLAGRAKVSLVDKLYFAVSKVVDLVIEEHAYANGELLHADGTARSYALTLFREGPRAFSSGDWEALLRHFVSFVRASQRKGNKTSLEEMLLTIDRLRLVARRRRTASILELLWEARDELRQYTRRVEDSSPANLDPLIPAIFSTANAWFSAENRPIRIIHDQQSALRPEVLATLTDIANNPHPEFPHRIPLELITTVDSATDPRVQVADLVAGFGRVVGELALDDRQGDLNLVLRPMLDIHSLWGDGTSWQWLSGEGL